MNLDEAAELLARWDEVEKIRYKLPEELRYKRTLRRRLSSKVLKKYPEAAGNLTDMEKKVINMLYGFGIGNYPSAEPCGLSKVARGLKITRARVQQLTVGGFKGLMEYYYNQRHGSDSVTS